MPGTDIRLGRKRDGEHEHRPGFDITFSAPKSVSLAALLPTAQHPRGDRTVLRCHDEAVNAVLAGDPGEAVELLGGSVHEAPFEELAEKAAEAWLELGPEAREGTLLVAPTHELRAGINAAVREALAAEGVLRGKALRIERLVSLGMTRAEKADARNYREGDTVLFNQDMVNFRVKRDEALTVTGAEEDRVLLLHPDGRPRRIAPQEGYYRYRLEVYESQEIEIRAGDRIRWTRNDKRRELVNGGRAAVAAITRDRVRFALDDGRSLSLRHDDPQLRHLDHAWSSTMPGARPCTGRRAARRTG